MLIRVATTGDLIAEAGGKSLPRARAVRPGSSRALHLLLKQSLSHPERLVLVWSSHELRPLPPLPKLSHPGNRQAPDVRARKGYKGPTRLAALVRRLKRGNSVIEAMKALVARQAKGRRQAGRGALPVVEVPAAAPRTAAAMKVHTAGTEF